MNWKDEEVEEGIAQWTEGAPLFRAVVRRIMTRAVELVAARGGTMTAEDFRHLERMIRYCDGAPELAVLKKLRVDLSTLGARNAVLEAEVKRLSESAAVTETMALRREVSEPKARCATLSAAGQVLSAHMDKPDGHEDCPDNPCPAHFPYCEGANRDTPQRYPCSPTCTHDDAATPGHPERVEERSEAVTQVASHAPYECEHGIPRRDDCATCYYYQGAEAMRVACLEAARQVLQRHGFTGEQIVNEMKAAIEGAVP